MSASSERTSRSAASARKPIPSPVSTCVRMAVVPFCRYRSATLRARSTISSTASAGRATPHGDRADEIAGRILHEVHGEGLVEIRVGLNERRKDT